MRCGLPNPLCWLRLHRNKRVTASTSELFLVTLRQAFLLSRQTVRFIFLDLLWKTIWLLFVALSASVVALWAAGAVASVRLEGPDLDSSNPIIWIAVMRELWSIYGTTIIVAAASIVLAAIGAWLMLEALFRGGWRNFWVYIASGTARFVVLVSAILALGWPALQRRDAGLGFLALVILLGIWCLVTMLETAIRSDAVEVLAINLLPFAATLGFLQFVQVMAAIIVWGGVALLLRAVSTSSQAVIAVALVALLAFLWTAFQSYLLAARFSAVDIMRRSAAHG